MVAELLLARQVERTHSLFLIFPGEDFLGINQSCLLQALFRHMFLFRVKYDFLNLHLIISLVMLGCLRQRYYVLSQEFEFLLILPETLQCRGKYGGDRASANLQLNIFVVCCKASVSCD